MTPDDIFQLVAMLADMRRQILLLQADNAALREQLQEQLPSAPSLDEAAEGLERAFADGS